MDRVSNAFDIEQLPLPVQEAARLIHAAGEPAWLVGGATRDLFLGKNVKDFDFVLGQDGLKWARRIAFALGGAFVPLDEERGIGRVVVEYQGKPLLIDVAHFRGAADQGEGETLEEDLLLRDFTVNAIALDPLQGHVVDPSGGMIDLGTGVLRATGPHVFEDDPLRVLRALRLHATHDLQIEPETWQAMVRAAPALENVAAERIREEWMRMLAPPGAMRRVEMLEELGVLRVVVPELLLGQGVTQSQPHSHDVYGHNLLVLDAIEQLWPWSEEGRFWDGELAPFAERMAMHLQEEIAQELPRWLLLKHIALLHDIGKPATRSIGKDGRIHYYGHERAGAEMIADVMKRMKFAAKCVQYAEVVVRNHLRPLQLSQHLPPSDRAVYRFFRDTGDVGPEIALHSIADQRGKAFAEDRAEVVAVVTRLLEAYFEQPDRFVHPQPLLDGNDVMLLSDLQGREVGEMLEMLREHQAQGRVRTRADAEALLRNVQRSKRGGTSKKR